MKSSLGLRRAASAVLPKLGVLTALIFGSLTPRAEADSMRCGSKLVVDGDSLHEVRSRCGEPDTQLRRMEQRTLRQWISGPCRSQDPRSCGQMVERTVEVVIDEWTYDFGPHRFVQHLTFEQGTLRTIVSGARGSK